ncbi:MAG: cyd operon YbgE family protein [Pseudomonadales bacterium]|jgi:cyd operon protein YbgE
MSEPAPEDQARQAGVLGSGWARLLSFSMALALSGLLFVAPQVVAQTDAEINHLKLMLAMWGISAGFVHGVGFIPRMRLWRLLLGPLAAWTLMGLSICWWVL